MDKQIQVVAVFGLHTDLGPGSQMNLYVVKTNRLGACKCRKLESGLRQ